MDGSCQEGSAWEEAYPFLRRCSIVEYEKKFKMTPSFLVC